MVHAAFEASANAAVSRDGRLFAMTANGGPVEIYETFSGLLLQSVPVDKQSDFRLVAFAPGGDVLAVAGGPDAPGLLDVRRGTWLRRFDRVPVPATAVATSDGGAWLAVGDEQGRIHLFGRGSEPRATMEAHAGPVRSLAISADGKVIWSLGEDGRVRRWTQRGRTRGRGTDLGAPGVALASTADAEHVAALTADGRVHVPPKDGTTWDVLPAAPATVRALGLDATGDGVTLLTADGRLWRQGRSGGPAPLATTSATYDASQGVVAGDGAVAVLRTADAFVLRRSGASPRDHPLGAPARRPEQAWFSPGGTLLLRLVQSPAELRRLELYDLATGLPLEGAYTTEPLAGAAVAPDDRRLAVLGAGDSSSVRIVDPRTGATLVSVAATAPVDGTALFTPDGQRLLVALRDGSVEVRRADDGRLERTLRAAGAELMGLDIDPAGRHVLRVTTDFVVTVHDLVTGACAYEHTYPAQLRTGRFVADTKRYVIRRHVPAVGVAPWASGAKPKPPVEIPANTTDEDGSRAAIETFDVTRDGAYVAVAGTDRRARVFDIATGRLLQTFSPHRGVVRHVAFSPDGTLLVTSAPSDGTSRLHDVASGRLLAVIGSAPADGPVVDGVVRGGRVAWYVVDDEGWIDGARFEALGAVGWSDGERGWRLDALAAERHEPGLLARVIARRPAPRRAPGGAGPLPLPPVVHVAQPDPSIARVDITVENGGGGIGAVRVALNGREVVRDARGASFAPDSAVADLTVDLSGAANLLPGATNTLDVTAFDATNQVRTRGPAVTFRAPGSPLAAPAFHAVVCGVSDYAGEALDLKYPAKDARDFAAALELAATELFGKGATHVRRLGAPADEGATLATRENLLAALQDVARGSKANDTVVVYLAGHGVSPAGAADSYCYLTAGASGEGDAKEALPGSELVQALAAIPANRRAVILDTCAAGAVRDALGAGALGASEAVRLLREREGVYVLAGCAADRVSYESNVYGQGLLTYALLLGMSCGCHFTDGVFVDVARLMSFACEQVPWLCQQMGVAQPQRPVKAEGETSFPLGRLDLEARTRVPLAQPLPALVRASFHRVRPPTDTLLLGPAVDAAVRNLGADVSTRAPVAFVDTPRMVGAWGLAGTYTISSGVAKVDAYLVRQGKDEEEVVVEFRVEHAVASPDEVAALARSLVDRAVDEIASR